MKFPSLVKLPRNKQFKYRPRYYDPDMEDLHERVTELKRSMGTETTEEEKLNYSKRISFRNAKNKRLDNTVLLRRLLIIILLVGNGFAYYELGFTKVFKYVLLIELLVGYLWFRFYRNKF